MTQGCKVGSHLPSSIEGFNRLLVVQTGRGDVEQFRAGIRNALVQEESGSHESCDSGT